MLSEEGLNVIGLPKTIDNDVWGTDMSFGFDSAFTIATEAIDRLHSTANSHGRTMVIEVMGHRAGWLALYSGLAAGGDIILIPEIPFKEEQIVDFLVKRHAMKKNSSIIVVAEGISPDKDVSAAKYISKVIKEGAGFESRDTILGYVQRGGTPTPYDRILATRYGAKAAEMIAEGEVGKMVALNGNDMTCIPLSEAGSKTQLVDPDSPLVMKARHLGTSFGD